MTPEYLTTTIIVNGLALLIIVIIIWLNFGKIVEGLTNNTTKANITSFSDEEKRGGESSAAPDYSEHIKSLVVKMQDDLLVEKYQVDYENILINMDDYINLLMLKQVLNINTNDTASAIASLKPIASLKKTKDALNDVMKFVDR